MALARHVLSGFAALAVCMLATGMATVTATATAAGPATGTAAAEGLMVAVALGPVSLPLYVAEAQGFFQTEGLQVQFKPCRSGRECLQWVHQGQAHVATAAELPVTLGSLTGADAVILATISTSAQHIKLTARRSAGIASAADLRGKRIATVGGTSAAYFLHCWLTYQGIDPFEVKLSFAAPEELGALLADLKTDAISIWDPLASRAADALGRDALVLTEPRVYVQHFNVVATRGTATAREGDLVKFLKALERAQRFIADKPAQAEAILKTKIVGSVAPGALSEHRFQLHLRQSLIATMDGQARWALAQGPLARSGPPPNLLRHIDAAPLRKAVPGAVDLVH